jgi:TPR repeat protein
VRLAGDSTVTREEQAAVKDRQEAEEDWAPVLLDFSARAESDAIGTRQLLGEFLASIPMSAGDSAAFQPLAEGRADPSAVARLHRMARHGNPEAMVLLGRLLAEGRQLRPDRLQAASLFATSVFLEAARGGQLLIALIRDTALRERIAREAYGGNPEAQYLWAVLHALEFDTRLAPAQALDMLKRAAAQDHGKALVQLGLCYASGRWVERDGKRAATFWRHAADLHDEEARVRLAAAAILGRSDAMGIPEALAVCEEAVRYGSILAEVALAASYEKGVGRTAGKGVAARMYRECAIRGSRTAYGALRRMHEELRPDDALFTR